CKGASDGEIGKSGAKAINEPVGDARAAAIEEVAAAPEIRRCAAGQHEIGTVDALDVRTSLEVSQPHERHAVRCHQTSALMNQPERLVALALHDSVYSRHADVMRRPRPHPAGNRADGLRHI